MTHDDIRKRARSAELEGRWAEALELYESIDGTDIDRRRVQRKQRLYDKIERALGSGVEGSSLLGDDDRAVYAFGRIQLSLHLRDSHLDAPAIFRAVRLAERRCRELLAVELPFIEVEITRDRRELVRHLPPGSEDAAWWAGHAEGRVIVNGNDERAPEPQRLLVLIAHEVVHLHVEHAAGGRAPAWLDEGLAVHLTQELPRIYEEALAKALEAGDTLRLTELESPFSGLQENQRRLAYSQSARLVAWLRTERGDEWLGRLVSRLERGDGWKAALRARGLTPYLLEREWIDAERARRGREGRRDAAALHAGCLAGDEGAWAEVHRMVLAACRSKKWGGSLSDPDGTAHDITGALLEKIDQVRDGRGFLTFLRTATGRAILDVLRGRRPTVEIDDEEAVPVEVLAVDSSQERETESEERTVTVREAIEQLDEPCRTTLLTYLAYLAGAFENQAAAAASLSQPLGTFSVNWRRCSKQLLEDARLAAMAKELDP